MDGDELIERWSATPHAHLVELDPDGDFAKRHLLNPSLFAALGDLDGRRVLDAGCGQGYLSRLLADRGATVVGLEPAEGLIRYARRQETGTPRGIEYVRADLTAPGLADALGERFDAVVVSMVLITIPDWRAALTTCVRALRPGGRLVVALTHPCFERLTGGWAADGFHRTDEYFAEYVLDQPIAPDFHRPLSTYLTAVADAGCRIVQVDEPRLDPELVPDGGPGAEALTHAPCFLVVAADREPVTRAGGGAVSRATDDGG